jgi:hypothetical protein
VLALQITFSLGLVGLTFILLCIVLYTVEFQKRGLPHIHCLVWLDAASSEFNVSTIDKFICAEIQCYLSGLLSGAILVCSLCADISLLFFKNIYS